MATWDAAKAEMGKGWTVGRAAWGCKSIRLFQDSDMDYFANEFDSKSVIVQECNKPCDCSIGVWIVEAGDKEADDWIFLTNANSRKAE